MTEEYEELKIPVSIKIAFIIITILFFAILIAFSWVVTDIQDISNKNSILVAKNIELVKNTTALTKENKARISDIQISRIESCKETYSGIYKVFLPFFPPEPRTKEQRDNLKKFKDTINDLRQGCTKQTSTSGP